MSRPSPVVVTVLALALLTACTSDKDEPGFRAPDAAALAAGPCSLVADDVVDLGRLAYQLRGVQAPDEASRQRLLSAQDRVDGFAATAPAPARPALQQLVQRTGLVRIQADTGHLDGAVLDSLRSSYAAAAAACTRPAGATPTATTG